MPLLSLSVFNVFLYLLHCIITDMEINLANAETKILSLLSWPNDDVGSSVNTINILP